MRTWLVRLVGAALVLALGIAIGAGPLQKSAERRNDELAAQKRAVSAKEREIASLRAGVRYGADYAAATAARLVGGSLTGRSVSVVVLPGAAPEAVAGVRALITAAGGTVTATVTFAPVLGKASSRQLVEALTSQMATQTPGLDLPAAASGYQRLGLLLARAVGVPGDVDKPKAAYDQVSVGIVSGLETAGLITTSKVSARAALTVAVTGAAAANADAAGENAIPTTVLRSYATAAPVVVAGPASAAGDNGIIRALRAETPVAGLSTVDTVDAVSGQVTAVLALAALARGTTGAWGGVGAEDGAVPPAS